MQKLKTPFVFILFGPTGVGKSDLAQKIAQSVPAEIVNMDVGSFYTPLTIGTAKPDLQSSTVAHHLFNVLDEPKNFTVVEYRELLLKTLENIWQRGKMPIVVGGSAFYLKSIFFPPEMDSAVPAFEHSGPDDQLWDELNKIDPDRAAHIHKNDIYRIKRALDIWRATGKKPSEYAPVYKPLSPFHLVFLTRDREQLYKRINVRVEKMLEQGLIEEVRPFVGTAWESFLQEKKLIGYNEILDYLASEQTDQDLKQAISMIQQRTRNYAKRQETFWRMLAKQLKDELGDGSHFEQVNLTSADLDLYIKDLLEKLLSLFD